MNKIEIVKRKLSELTPVQLIDGIYYKRDDLFQPFLDGQLLDNCIKEINGTKIRQALSLLINNLSKIKKECDNTIVAHQSVSTQQGILITSCANVFDVKTVLVVGRLSEKTFKNNVIISNIIKLGGNIDNSCKAAYNSVLDAKVNELVVNKNYFNFNFINNTIVNFDSLILPVAYQCKNIPDEVEQVVVPAGNAIIYAAVVIGCAIYKRSVKKVIGVQISGLNKSDVALDILSCFLMKTKMQEYLLPHCELLTDDTYSYSSDVDVQVGDIKLDPVYEAKAYLYMQENLDLSKKTLFWIAGNSFPSRVSYNK